MAPTPRNLSTVCLSCWKTKVLFTSVVLSSVEPSASIFMAEAPPAASILPSSGEEMLAPPRVVMALSQNFMSWYERLELTGWDMIKACNESELNNLLDKSTGTLACIDRGKQKFWKTDRVNQKPFKKQLRDPEDFLCEAETVGVSLLSLPPNLPSTGLLSAVVDSLPVPHGWSRGDGSLEDFLHQPLRQWQTCLHSRGGQWSG